MYSGWEGRGYKRCNRSSALPAMGAVLMGAGLILLFVCIPGWAWLALTGMVLIAAGFVLIRLGKGR